MTPLSRQITPPHVIHRADGILFIDADFGFREPRTTKRDWPLSKADKATRDAMSETLRGFVRGGAGDGGTTV